MQTVLSALQSRYGRRTFQASDRRRGEFCIKSSAYFAYERIDELTMSRMEHAPISLRLT